MDFLVTSSGNYANQERIVGVTMDSSFFPFVLSDMC
jgi:hypothetical protein